MSPCACTSSQIATAGIPLSIRDGIVVGSTQVLDAASPLFFRWSVSATNIVVVEVEVPELQF